MNLDDILQSAQGGQAIDNLAARFGLSPEQARAATSALIPILSAGLQHAAQRPGGLGEVLSHLGNDQHQASYSDPAAAQTPEAEQAGADAAGSIVGGGDKLDHVTEHAAAQTGLSPDLLKQMMPQLTSIVLGGVAAQMTQHGLGGILGQLSQAAGSGGLGGLLGGLMGGGAGAASGQQSGGGGLGGMIGGLAGSLFGGGGAAPGGAGKGGLDPATVQAGMDMLGKMFRSGPSGATTASGNSLEDEIGNLLGGKK